MTTLSPLNRFLVFVLVGGMFASLAFYAAQRTAQFWKSPFVRFARASRSIQALVLAGLIAVTALGGGKTNDPPLRVLGDGDPPRVVANPPAWFVALGYPATDADANGIPDCWEKWTHTTGMADDDDPDGDGLTNYDEFEAQTDPIRADTDGDGLDDGTELAGLAAGVADLDPLTPASFCADEPDADGDGIPDLWEDADITLFDGCDPDGFPWDISIPEAAATNYDVRLSVSSSRHAALSWGADESLLLPPCTNLALRLRLVADDIKTVELSPSPNASTNPVGTWRAALVADWDARRGLPTEGNRLALADGTMVDRSERESVSAQAWMPQPALRSSGSLLARGGGRDKLPEIIFTPRKLALIPLEHFCVIHGPNPLIQVIETNATPPYIWTEGGIESMTEQNTYRACRPFPDGHFEISCRWQDGHSSLLVADTVWCYPIDCRPGQTNYVGAGWTSAHDPTDASDHMPGIEEVERTFGPNCPVAHDVDVKLGWTHNTTLLWIRNLVRILTGDPKDDETDHCMARNWEPDGEVDLRSFIAAETLPFMDRLSFIVNGVSSGHVLRFGSKPRRYHPTVFHIELRMDGEPRALDRMWLVVNHPDTRPDFDQWLASNTNDLSWVSRLPKPYASIVLTTNASGVVSATDPEPGAPGFWTRPSPTKGSLLHHNAEWEMRAYGNAEGHGNQACYDGNGKLIESGMAGGTADYSPGFWDTVNSHIDNDVNPFLDAVHLDGNPGDTTRMNDVSRPCLHQGDAIDAYIFCRPIVKPPSSP